MMCNERLQHTEVKPILYFTETMLPNSVVSSAKLESSTALKALIYIDYILDNVMAVKCTIESFAYYIITT